MSNKVTQFSLVTKVIAARMRSQLHSAKLVDFSVGKARGASPTNRLTYVESVPPRTNVRAWTGEIADLTAGKQSTVFGSESFRVGQGYTGDFNYNSFEQVRDFDQIKRDSRLRMFGEDFGHRADASILSSIMSAGSDTVGTFNTGVSAVTALYSGIARLRDTGVSNNNLYAVLPITDMPAMARYLTELPAPTNVSQNMISKFQGLQDLAGVQVMFSSNCPVLTSGTRVATAGTVVTANQNVNYSDVSASSVNGQFLTATINLQGYAANATFRDGEIFTIAGVNSYDNRKQASRGRLQEFRVVGDQTASGTGTVTLRYWPAIIVPGTPLTGQTGINTAHATVTAAPAAAAAVTFQAPASTDTVLRAVMSDTVARVETSELDDLPSGVTTSVKMLDLPLSMRGHLYSNGDTGNTVMRVDVPWETNLNPYGRFEVCRIYG